MSNFVIEDGILWRYDGLEEVVCIPKGVRIIESNTFEYFSNLRKVIIPEGVTEIGDEAFRNCMYLRKIDYAIPITKFPNEYTKRCVLLGYVKGLQEGETFSPDVMEENNK